MITTIPKNSSKRSSKKPKDKDQHHQQGAVENFVDVDDDAPPVAKNPLPSLPAETLTLVTAVADWMGFTGDITYEMERYALTPPALLAWAFWVKAEGSRCRNPVGVCKSKWTGNERRGPELPPSKWLDLARAWLDLDDNGRLELLGTGGQSHLLSYEFPYPDVMPAFAELYKATRDDPPPDVLLPEYSTELDDKPDGEPDAQDEPEETAVTISVNGRRIAAVDEVWEMLLENVHNPGAKTWLTSAELWVDEHDRTAVLLVANSYAADWVNNRLLEFINREWQSVTKYVGQAWSDLTFTSAVDAAQLEPA